MPEPLDLFFSIVFSVIGMGYLKYGRKAGGYFSLAGVGLIAYTFLVSSTVQIILVGVILVVAPFILDRLL